jgi:hypothetical protein
MERHNPDIARRDKRPLKRWTRLHPRISFALICRAFFMRFAAG